MEMHQLRYFLAVCETLNFTRAAEQCHVAQPSLTRAIQKLEEELGGPLFRRERSRTHLTDLGRLMQPHIKAAFDATLAARAEAEGFRSLDRAPVRMGVMSTVGPSRLIDFLSRMRRDIPSLDLAFQEAAGKDLVETLLKGDLDIALIGLPSYPDRVDAIPLFEERYMIAFPRGHRFEAMSAVPVAELEGENYLKRVHCEFMDHFEAMGAPVQFTVNLRYSSEREDWVQAMVLAGMGCSIMPEHLPSIPGIATRVLIEPEVSRTISLVTVAGRRFSPAVAALVGAARGFAWAG